MYLYSTSCHQATSITQAIYGSFTKPNQEELVVAKGKILELLKIDEITGKVQLVYRQEVFGLIRNIVPFRLMGMQKDFVVVGSDSGRIVILEFDHDTNRFVKIHQETFGKTGVRRIVPGEYLATDPKGRAIMIGAVEKQKFVYILNRDSNNKLTISSPLEAFKPHIITLAMVGVDVGIENPQFACLEIDYGDLDQNFSAVNTGNFQKTLTLYEMDLGLNHVIRKNIFPVDRTAHTLLQVPLEGGPGGIIVVCENFLVYKKVNHEDCVCYFPQRRGHDLARGLFITSHSIFNHETFFFMLQSEYGDLYKLTLDFTEQDVHAIQIQFFDTVAPGTCINILSTGFLFLAAESSNHACFQFIDDGSSEENATISFSQDSARYEQSLDLVPRFNPRRPVLLAAKDEIKNLAPIHDMRVEDLTGEGQSQIYIASGRGAQGTIRALRHGLSVLEMAVQSMPGQPLRIKTLKNSLEDQLDSLMIVSFQDTTLVLQIMQDKVTQVTNSGFQANESTLHCGLLHGDIFIQVTSRSLIQIKGRGENRRRTKWESDKGRILMACSNSRQVVIYIEGGQIVYFELDQNTGLLNEIQTEFFLVEIKCIDIGEVPEGRLRSKFMVAGFADNTVKILSLEPDQPEIFLHKVSMLALQNAPESVCFVNLGAQKSSDRQHTISQGQLYLNVGLQSGVLMRQLVDNVTGVMTDSRQQFLGTRGIQLTKIKVQGEDAVVALSNKLWLCYSYLGQYRVTPISYEALQSVCPFSSTQCSEGIVAICENTLRILKIESLGEQFTQHVVNTTYTPCKMQVHPETNYLIVLEKDHQSKSIRQLEEQKQQIYEETKDEEYRNTEWSELGAYPKSVKDSFASCIRVIDPSTMETLSELHFTDGETCFSIYVSQGPLGQAYQDGAEQGESFLFCGVGQNATLTPRGCSLGYIKTYRFTNRGRSLELLHRTHCEDIPNAFSECAGKLIAGVGNILRVYDLGLKKLLRKQENKNFVSPITSIQVEEGGRIFAADLSESIHVLKYKADDAQLYIFADDVLKRWTTSFCMLDQDTVVGVDKFENIYVNRMPAGCEDDAEDDPTATKFKWENGYLNGAAFKMESINQFFLGEMGTKVIKCQLNQQTGQELILVATTMGSLQAFVPFETREDVDFFSHLEMYLRIESQPLCGRDHVMFRSVYAPVKDVIDGDLCQMFSSLELNKQRVLSDELDRTPPEVLKKLESLGNKIL